MTENTNYIFEELFKAAQPNRGLFVMPLPTGAGKTYNSCQMMAEELKKEDARRIIYVTDAKKQLDATIEDIENKSNLSKIVYIMIWNSVCWKFYSFNWGTNKKQNC